MGGDKPLCIDLFCGLGGWSEGFLAEGFDVIGFDIEQRPYPGQLVLQDALTITGTQLARLPNLAAIVASPPCTEYSYMAMPWSRGKQIAAALCEEVPFPDGYTGSRSLSALTALFRACFRIQREASEAAGREIPMVVENVKGAQPWVGRARANFGSFYLWGDVDSIGGRIVRRGDIRFGMPTVKAAARGMKANPDGTAHGQGSWFAIADSKNRGSGLKVPGNNTPRMWADREVQRLCDAPLTGYGGSFGWDGSKMRTGNSKSPKSKQASAEIAKIPFPLARYIAQVFKPLVCESAHV